MIVTAYIDVGFVGCKKRWEVVIPDEDLEGLTDRERDTYIDEYVYDELPRQFTWGWTSLDV